MKRIIYLVILLGIVYGGLKLYAPHAGDGEFGELIKAIPGIGGDITKTFNISTRQCVVTTREGKKLCKTYRKQVTYSYSARCSAKERKKAKEVAYRSAMEELVSVARKEISSIREGLRYYDDVNRQLIRLNSTLPTTASNKVFVWLKRCRSLLKERKHPYILLPVEHEKMLESFLGDIASSLSGYQKQSVLSAGNSFIDWYNERFVKYPVYRNFKR